MKHLEFSREKIYNLGQYLREIPFTWVSIFNINIKREALC